MNYLNFLFIRHPYTMLSAIDPLPSYLATADVRSLPLERDISFGFSRTPFSYWGFTGTPWNMNTNTNTLSLVFNIR